LDAVGIRSGGDSGPAVIPGHAADSLLIQAVRQQHESLAMPPKQKLKPDEIDSLVDWVNAGAVWPAPVQVLLEDDPAVVDILGQGDGQLQLITTDHASGNAAAEVKAPERFNALVPGWEFFIREQPGRGEYRYLRFAWKKLGGGSAMLEVANAGQWPARESPAGRYVAGIDATGLAATPLGDEPLQWTIATVDLWAGLGDFTLTGLSLMASGGEAALFDAIVLGPTIESLDAYSPARQSRQSSTPVAGLRIGDAWSDSENPIVKIFHGDRLDLWSMKKPVATSPPAVKNGDWIKTPVDAFVLSQLEAKGLAPSPEADRRTLARRVYFDLTGLPPTPQEMQDFLDDPAADAYERLVDRLLASPRYGERWARHWLDVVRYSDTNGFERDEFRPNCFRFRDYVVRSLNQDKPYDEFVREQLAGDEMVTGEPQTPADADRLIATGFLRLGPFDSTVAIFQEDAKGRDQLMADLANTTGSAFLGLTMSCCRCHDHKYDPLSQADHFRLRAFFAGVAAHDEMNVSLPAERQEIDQFNAPLDAAVAEKKSQIAKLLEPARAQLLAARQAEIPADVAELLKTPAADRTAEVAEKLKPFEAKLQVSDEDATAALGEGEKQQRTELLAVIESLGKERRGYALALAATDSGTTAPPTNIFYQGDFSVPREEVPPGFLSILDPNPAEIAPQPNGKTTGRRTALAEWIVSPDNPLTARVMMTRLWQHHFGHGLVETANDFGFSGARPTNPALLDWLAVQFVEQHWSLKQMHRLMVLSATYRQSSAEDEAKHRLDPDNLLLWRQNVGRLDAETLHDALLAVSGKLLSVDSGAPAWPDMPAEIIKGQPKTTEKTDRLQGWYTSPEAQTYVRGLFLVQKRSIAIPFLEVFDLPDFITSCARRNTTTVAPQALSLLNSRLAMEVSRAFAARVAAEAGAENPARIERAYRLALGRTPDGDELALCGELLSRHAEIHRAAGREAPEQAALVDLCRTLINLNEFMYLD
ncbi:MAG TPA: PSD1 and planctomycete cytochrome C domain-containing protein, partial [Pirellulales bacterium]